jgi:hypothetical protein
MSVIENGKPAGRRRECSGTATWQRRRTSATDERLAMDRRYGRSARSEARARNAVIDDYARGVASTHAPAAAAAEMRNEL